MKYIILTALLSAGCYADKLPVDPCSWHRVGRDPVVYERVFTDCLKALPKGPERLAAAGNDWNEVVEECRRTAADVANDVAAVACRRAQGERL